MRLGWVGLVLATGCATTTGGPTTMTVTTQRVALAPLPATPLGLAAAPGIGIGARVAAGVPQKQQNGGGVAFPAVQPELSGVLQLGERTWLGTRFELATTGLGLYVPPGSPRFAGDEVAYLASVGVAHDIPLGKVFNLVGALDLGFTQTTFLATSSIHAVKVVTLEPNFSTALGVAAKLGAFRLYLVGGVATHVWNNASSTLTRTCATSCTDVDTGVLTTTFVGTLGGGVRWQPKPGVALVLEVAVPLTVDGTRLPPLLSLAVRLGDAVVGRPPPPVSAPAPPPSPPPMPVVPVESYPGP